MSLTIRQQQKALSTWLYAHNKKMKVIKKSGAFIPDKGEENECALFCLPFTLFILFVYQIKVVDSFFVSSSSTGRTPSFFRGLLARSCADQDISGGVTIFLLNILHYLKVQEGRGVLVLSLFLQTLNCRCTICSVLHVLLRSWSHNAPFLFLFHFWCVCILCIIIIINCLWYIEYHHHQWRASRERKYPLWYQFE